MLVYSTFYTLYTGVCVCVVHFIIIYDYREQQQQFLFRAECGYVAYVMNCVAIQQATVIVLQDPIDTFLQVIVLYLSAYH